MNEVNELEIKKEKLKNIQELMQEIDTAFIADRSEKVIKLFEYMCRHREFYSQNLGVQRANHLLCIGYLYGCDKKLIDSFTEVKEYLSKENERNKLYRLMCQDDDAKIFDSANECIATYVCSKIFGFERDLANHLRRRINKQCIPYISKIKIGKGCHQLSQVNKVVWIRINNNKKKLRILKIEARYCSKCDQFYIDEKLLKYKGMDLSNKIEGIQTNNIISKRKSKKAVVPSYAKNIVNQIKVKETTVIRDEKRAPIHWTVSTQDKSSDFLGNLNQESPLKRLGYSTKKSKEERWRILQQEAVPRLGRDTVIGYLKMFIRMHDGRTQMAVAVSTWKYDLQRLGKH